MQTISMDGESLLPVNTFKWIKKLSKFNERSVVIRKAYIEYPKKIFNLHSDLPF